MFKTIFPFLQGVLVLDQAGGDLVRLGTMTFRVFELILELAPLLGRTDHPV